MQHFNIGKKEEINPFEMVKWVTIAHGACSWEINQLKSMLHKAATSVETRKINGEFQILLAVGLLDFTTLLQWFEPYRGKFRFAGRSIHFRIEDDLMIVW